MNINEIFHKTIAQRMNDKILQVIQITIWIKDFYGFFYHCTKAILEQLHFGEGLHSLSTLVSKTGRKKF